jgi:hypothetical protein
MDTFDFPLRILAILPNANGYIMPATEDARPVQPYRIYDPAIECLEKVRLAFDGRSFVAVARYKSHGIRRHIYYCGFDRMPQGRVIEWVDKAVTCVELVGDSHIVAASPRGFLGLWHVTSDTPITEIPHPGFPRDGSHGISQRTSLDGAT